MSKAKTKSKESGARRAWGWLRAAAKAVAFALGVGALAVLSSPALTPIQTFLESRGLFFDLGAWHLSLYALIRGALTLALLIWIVTTLADFVERRIRGLRRMRTSSKALLTKIAQIGLYCLAFFVGMDMLGINLTALTVFSGAVGIGIGIGLQTITSNFISGLVLLFERSVEINDLVELEGGITGFVRATRARYTMIETFDGKEVMLPNDYFIANPVTNCTLSNAHGRVEVPVGVAYGSDVERVREIMLDAAQAHPRCTAEPAPACFLTEFADSSINFTLFFWVADVSEGRLGPRSDVMRAIWAAFQSEGIDIPFPQRDLHIRNPEALR